MKPSLYLHIGHPKAGSTTLQTFMVKNYSVLKEHGYTMPTARLDIAEGNSPPGNPLSSLQKIKANKDGTRLKYWIENACKQSDKLLLSSECLFEWYWHTLFIELQDLVDIHLIYYVRRQDETLLSAWRQWGLKTGRPLESFIAERIERGHPDYWGNIAPWRNKVGLASLHVRFIDPAFLHGGDVQSDLAHHLGLPINKMSTVPKQNTSVDARLLLFMNKRPEMFSSVHDDSIFSLLTPPSNGRGNHDLGPPKKLTLTQQLFDEIYATFEGRNQAFLKKFHPKAEGVPVIDPMNARIGPKNPYSTQEQQSFLSNLLSLVTESEDPRVIALKREFCTL